MELASAYVSITPTLKGAGKSLSSQLGGIDVSSSGRKLGRQLSDGLSASVSSKGVSQLENAVASASAKVGQAMHSQKAAVSQLAIAQQRLAETQQKYAAGSSQVMAATERVKQAEYKHAQACLKAESAQTELKRAQDQLAASGSKVASASATAAAGVSKVGGAAKGTAGLLRGVATAAAGAFAAVGFGSIVSGAAQAADATKKFRQTLDFAGLDTSQIDALSASTKAYADQTVYALSDIQGITAQLAANSVPDYDRLAEAAGNLNAVAGGNAETFKSVGMVLTQTAGAGKLTTENWNQLADAIPGASGMLQDAMLKNGAYTGNFREAMEKGQISAEEFNRAIMDLGMSDAAAEAARSTETFEGAFGNLRATVEGGLSQMLGTLSPSITGAVNSLNDALGPAMDAANAAVSAFAGAVEGGKGPVDALKAAFETLPDPARNAALAVAAIGGAFAAAKLGSAAVAAGGALKGMASSIAAMAGRGAAAGAGRRARGRRGPRPPCPPSRCSRRRRPSWRSARACCSRRRGSACWCSRRGSSSRRAPWPRWRSRASWPPSPRSRWGRPCSAQH